MNNFVENFFEYVRTRENKSYKIIPLEINNIDNKKNANHHFCIIVPIFFARNRITRQSLSLIKFERYPVNHIYENILRVSRHHTRCDRLFSKQIVSTTRLVTQLEIYVKTFVIRTCVRILSMVTNTRTCSHPSQKLIRNTVCDG